MQDQPLNLYDLFSNTWFMCNIDYECKTVQFLFYVGSVYEFGLFNTLSFSSFYCFFFFYCFY